MLMTRRNEIDMLNGPVFSRIIAFSVPIMLSGWLQLLYNAADLIVVGRCAGDHALAAVGATGPLIVMMTNFFITMSIGANAAVARFLGEGNDEGASRAAHTGILFGILAGLAVGLAGSIGARVFLSATGTPSDIIDSSVLYLRLYSIGMPFTLVYNFCAAALRAKGDTRRPLYILSGTGLVNVLLNLFFVLVLGMDVDGVALATAISQILAAFLIILCLVREKSPVRLMARKLRIHGRELGMILKIGMPAAIQAILFNFSNVLYQSAVNSFGSMAIAGNTASMQITNFVFQANVAVPQAAVTFTSQNVGARQYSRIGRIVKSCAFAAGGITAMMSIICFILRYPLLSLYTTDSEAMRVGVLRLAILLPGYCVNGFSESFVGTLRALGKSLTSMIITVFGVCGLRILTLYVIFPHLHTLKVLYWSYPITWLLTGLAQMTLFFITYNKLPKDGEEFVLAKRR